MRWVAPTEKDEANHALEKRVWDAADQFRANSGLKAGEYSGPVKDRLKGAVVAVGANMGQNSQHVLWN